MNVLMEGEQLYHHCTLYCCPCQLSSLVAANTVYMRDLFFTDCQDTVSIKISYLQLNPEILYITQNFCFCFSSLWFSSDSKTSIVHI